VRVRFLGTGTSHGVPMIGCDCRVCRSSDPRDSRTSASIHIACDDGLSLLVDTSTDLRAQALRADLRRVDAVLFTHAHADHIMGLDEVRRFNVLSGTPMPMFGTAATLADLRRTFAYVFSPGAPRGGGVPDVRLWPIGGPFCLGTTEVVPIPLQHGPWQVMGFRFGSFAYLTDCSAIPAESQDALRGVQTLVLDALRHTPHPTHFTVEEAIAAARMLQAKTTYFTHIAHDLGHQETCAMLPAGFSLAYDGLTLEIDA
jgi:phosphoribosyl 1,2-cyclic phosphate phosphodiesterase